VLRAEPPIAGGHGGHVPRLRLHGGALLGSIGGGSSRGESSYPHAHMDSSSSAWHG